MDLVIQPKEQIMRKIIEFDNVKYLRKYIIFTNDSSDELQFIN